MSKAKVKFDKTIARCDEMVCLYKQLKESGETPSQDILRGAIVLSVAAFDAYATDCFSEHFISYIKTHSITDEIVRLLTDAGLDLKFSLELINSERPYRKIRTLIDRYYAKYTTQDMKVVDNLFKLYGLKHITKDAAKMTKKSEDAFIKSINKLIERRHSIVHDGDYNEHGKIKQVKETDLNRIKNLRELVNNMEIIINNRFHQTSSS